MTHWHPGTHEALCEAQTPVVQKVKWSMKEFPYPVTLDWARRPNMERWNEICAWTIEHFGLPGIRYQTEVDVARMTWYFQSQQDQLVMTVAWGNDTLPRDRG